MCAPAVSKLSEIVQELVSLNDGGHRALSTEDATVRTAVGKLSGDVSAVQDEVAGLRQDLEAVRVCACVCVCARVCV